MRDIINGFQRFDRIDWMFFIFLGICNLYMIFMAVAALIGGAPIYITVLLFIAVVGLGFGYVNATMYAMGLI